MKRILCIVAAAAVGLTAGTVQAQGFTPVPKMNYQVLALRAVETGRLEGVVSSVDPAGRKVDIKGPSGKVRTIKAAKNIQGLEKINAGDAIVAETYQSATFLVAKKGETLMAPEAVAAFQTASRPNEVIEAGEVIAQGTATVAAIDKTAQTITFTGPAGRSFPFKVENPVLLSGVSVGQTVDYRLLEQVAFDVKVTPKPAPPPPPPPPTGKAKIEGKKIVIEDVIFFDTNKDTIQPRSYDIITDVAAVMKANPNLNVRVEGHASKDAKSAARGKAGADFNLRLSDLRAKAVKAYLVEKGIAPERLEAVGFGWNQPIAPNDTKEGRYKNQRVDFVITN